MIASSLLGASALYYSTIEPDGLRTLLAALFILILCLSLLLRPRILGRAAWVLAMFALALWFVTDRPSNDRDWAPEYAVAATWSRAGDVIAVHDVRDFSYRTDGTPIPNYYNASYALDDLATVDLVTSHWSGDAIAHVFLTFGFKGGQHLAFSIETRRQRRFPYSVIAGFFHHFELMYVVADERDLIGVRTDIRHERVYLYRLNVTPAVRARLFLSYLDMVRRLASKPEWYNTVTDNCTTGVLQRADAKAGLRFDWRIVLSGYAPQLAYAHNLLDTHVAFPVLRHSSLIVRPAGSVPDALFSREIRERLPFLTFEQVP